MRTCLALLLTCGLTAALHADTTITYKGQTVSVSAATIIDEGKLTTDGQPTPLIVGSDKRSSRVAKYPPITAVVVATGVSVTLKGGRSQVEVEGPENILPVLTTTIADGVLTIGATKPFTAKDRPTVEVHLSHLKRLEVNGGGDVDIEGGVISDDAELCIAGAGEITAAGELKTLKVVVNGSGEMHLAELVADTAEVAIVGSAEVELEATTTLKVTLAGTGTVLYHGEPKAVTVALTGTGKVEHQKEAEKPKKE